MAAQDTLDGIRSRIKAFENRISEAKGFRTEVSQYRGRLDGSWSQKAKKEQAWQTADAKERCYKREAQMLINERTEVLKQKNTAIEAIGKKIDSDYKLQVRARNQVQDLSVWPQDLETLEAGLGNTPMWILSQRLARCKCI